MAECLPAGDSAAGVDVQALPQKIYQIWVAWK